ncbi:hypothetical protein NHX12_026605 [Muraenolepis orangiensis]|uniref:Uncharacterized protein n=1 Tax=Muraenolepis orangiensis TaxID=630683 RepID=A0A9Q0IS12_9TELE|nr:hypothetical protein NHX12_026605 [Muraenolepis orangiensis]
MKEERKEERKKERKEKRKEERIEERKEEMKEGCKGGAATTRRTLTVSETGIQSLFSSVNCCRLLPWRNPGEI